VDRLIGLDGVLSDIAMMRTPDGHRRVELTKFRRPTADSAEPNNAPPNTLDVASCLPSKTSIMSLRGSAPTVPNWLASWCKDENSYRLYYLRGPEGILVALVEKIG
jgi:hypothetical protein